MILEGKTIILGVTGSIAAYKAADMISEFAKQGVKVYPVMTQEAKAFITPLTLKTLSKNSVGTSLWDAVEQWQPDHINLADKADLLLVAPATAHTIACFAHGLAPDLLTSIYLATQAPVVVAPAMNVKMWKHPATQRNVEILGEQGVTIIEPEEGMLACGYEGMGKLAPIPTIVSVAFEMLRGV